AVHHAYRHVRARSSVAPPSPPQTHPLSLHDALPICALLAQEAHRLETEQRWAEIDDAYERIQQSDPASWNEYLDELAEVTAGDRSEEHTSELQSRFDLVCRLLLENKQRRTSLQMACF